MYSIGDLENPQTSDEHFSEYNEAEFRAIEGSFDDSVWAVWDHDSGEILAIVYQQIVYRP